MLKNVVGDHVVMKRTIFRTKFHGCGLRKNSGGYNQQPPDLLITDNEQC